MIPHVVITVPLAAGIEALNPNLATAGPEARPANPNTTQPSWTALLDDRAVFVFERLPKGTHDLYFRTRPQTAGAFIQPAATAELVYDRKIVGLSAGAKVTVIRE